MAAASPPRAATQASSPAGISLFFKLYSICQAGGCVIGMSATSMAAPHVSGLAGLMVAQHGRSPAKVRAALEQSADDLGQAGTDPFYGKGRINGATATGSN